MRDDVEFTSPHPTLTYEQQLQDNPTWAMLEGSRHFHEKSAVFVALNKIAARLDELAVPYQIIGDLALFKHGLRRFTESFEIVVSKENLAKIHDALDGLGYLPVHRHSKNLRDTELGVRIEFLVTGGFPGDGKTKPVAFPDPRSSVFEADGVKYAKLETVIELKLASGMTNPGRLKDLADVQELIKVLGIPKAFAEQLNPYVRDRYLSLWQDATWSDDEMHPADDDIAPRE